eukprot:10582340-Alexandrium_andersonii.AAC.1
MDRHGPPLETAYRRSRTTTNGRGPPRRRMDCQRPPPKTTACHGPPETVILSPETGAGRDGPRWT